LSEQGGCTRLVLEEAKCVRAEKIREEAEVIFDVGNDDDVLAEAIKTCANNHNMAQFQSREQVVDQVGTIDLIRLSWQTHVFGFIDDMFIGTEYDPENDQNRVVNFHSQLRVGKADMTFNEYYVKEMVACLEAKFGRNASPKKPCTQ